MTNVTILRLQIRVGILSWEIKHIWQHLCAYLKRISNLNQEKQKARLHIEDGLAGGRNSSNPNRADTRNQFLPCGG